MMVTAIKPAKFGGVVHQYQVSTEINISDHHMDSSSIGCAIDSGGKEMPTFSTVIDRTLDILGLTKLIILL